MNKHEVDKEEIKRLQVLAQIKRNIRKADRLLKLGAALDRRQQKRKGR